MPTGYNLKYKGAQIDALLDKINDLGYVTQSTAGLMSATDKTKLDSIANGAEVNVIENVTINSQAGTKTGKTINFNTDTAPVQGSLNLVTSGGIFTAILNEAQQRQAGDATVTELVNGVRADLANYYLKTQTYSKTEVDALVAAVKQFIPTLVQTLPEPSASTMYILYLVPSSDPTAGDVKDEYITVMENSQYKWEKIGKTSIDLSAYSTTEQMNAAIAASAQATLGTVWEALLDYAKKDGWYSTLTVGLAENLVDTKGTGSEQVFTDRTSCGDTSITDDGSGVIQEQRGKSVKWNQLVKNGNFASGTDYWSRSGFSFAASNNVFIATASNSVGQGDAVIYNENVKQIPGHKYLFKCDYFIDSGNTSLVSLLIGIRGTTTRFLTVGSWAVASGIATSSSANDIFVVANGTSIHEGDILKLRNVIVTDLTAIFGSGNEPSTVAEFESWLAANLPVLPYYPYTGDKGVIINNCAGNLVTVGFNQYNPATGKLNVFAAHQYQITGTYTGLTLDGDTITPDSNGLFTPSKSGELTVTGGNDTDTCVHFTWSGYRNGEYEPYWKRSIVTSMKKMYGKLNGAGDMVQIFPDGGCSVGALYDSVDYTKKTAEVKAGMVDMGNLTWGYTSGANSRMEATVTGIKNSPDNIKGNLICSKYRTVAVNTVYNHGADGIIGVHQTASTVWVYDSSAGTDPSAFKTAMNGVSLVYELATPLHYTDVMMSDDGGQTFYDLPSVYKVADFGTESIEPLTDENGNPVTSAFRAVIKYNNDFTREIVNLPQNYVRRDNLHQSTGNDTTLPLSQKGVEDHYAHKAGMEDKLIAGAAKSLYGDAVKSGEFIFRQVQGGSGLARVKEVKGNSLVWNQVLTSPFCTTYTVNGVTYTAGANGLVTISGTNDGVQSSTRGQAISLVVGHKYYIKYNINGSGVTCQFNDGSTQKKGNNTAIQTAANTTGGVYFVVDKNAVASATVQPIVIDLTLMFGAGNEPSTVAEFEKLFPLPYYANNAGSILSNTTTAMEVRGFNQWDEEWEVGDFDAYGNKTSGTTTIRSKNYIPVFADTEYYFNGPGNVFEYDASKNFVIRRVMSDAGTFTTAARTAFLMFQKYAAYGTTYKNDIAISISSARNGQYEPYSKTTVAIPITTMTGKVNGEGESVTIFGADGMKSAGSVYDSLIVDNDGWARKAVKRQGIVDFGLLSDLNYSGSSGRFNSSDIVNLVKKPINDNYAVNAIVARYNLLSETAHDVTPKPNMSVSVNQLGKIYITNTSYTTADAFKAANLGIKMVYELATPIEYVLDTPIYLGYTVDNDGTEKQVPENTSTPATAPLVLDVVYALDARKELTGLTVNYISKESLTAMLEAMKTAGVFTSYTMEFNSETQKYQFTFSVE